MNASVVFSYAFVYFVLFVVVPFVLVTFAMTCIKFFKSEGKSEGKAFKFKGSKVSAKAQVFLSKLSGAFKNKYSVLYGTCLDSILDIDNNKDEQAHEYLRACHLDYVLVDPESSAVKLVITDPEHNSPERNAFIDHSLAEVGIKVLHLDTNVPCDEALLTRSLSMAA